MGKLTYANMKKQLRAIHDCGSNDSVSEDKANFKAEASYSDDKADTREKSVFFFYTYIFNWDSLHARLNSHYEAWCYKKKKHKKITAYQKSV